LPCDPLRFSPRPPIHTHHCVQHNTHTKTCHAFPGPHRESPHDAHAAQLPARNTHTPLLPNPSSPRPLRHAGRRRSSATACHQPRQAAKTGGGQSPEGNLGRLPATVLPCTVTPTVTRPRLPPCLQSPTHPRCLTPPHACPRWRRCPSQSVHSPTVTAPASPALLSFRTRLHPLPRLCSCTSTVGSARPPCLCLLHVTAHSEQQRATAGSHALVCQYSACPSLP